MINPITTLTEKLEALTSKVKDNKIDNAEALKELLIIVNEYNEVKDDEINSWRSNFFNFFNKEDAKIQMRDLFNSYLQTEEANDKDDRSRKLFVVGEIDNLFSLLNP